MAPLPLVLEVNETIVDTTRRLRVGDTGVMLTPKISPDYWAFRVRLSEGQAILGFPKFGTIGVGFEHEDDWNTNLPCLQTPEGIYKHIAHNKGDARLSKTRVLAAITMVCEAGEAYLRQIRGDVEVDEAKSWIRLFHAP